MNRHKFDRPESSIDPSYELIHARSEILVLFHVTSRRDCDLDKDDFAHHLGVRGEKGFECVKLLRDTFDVVKTVDTDYYLDSLEAGAELGNSLLDRRGVDSLGKVIDQYGT
jgi:hypothetical protein